MFCADAGCAGAPLPSLYAAGFSSCSTGVFSVVRFGLCAQCSAAALAAVRCHVVEKAVLGQARAPISAAVYAIVLKA